MRMLELKGLLVYYLRDFISLEGRVNLSLRLPPNQREFLFLWLSILRLKRVSLEAFVASVYWEGCRKQSTSAQLMKLRYNSYVSIISRAEFTCIRYLPLIK
jgi:hypothetical protein